ncbi:uncharacterized protein LOC122504737 [Leptopilina heterotoma]|uniref:uncharacterized protein LOC122504737 n=1 Tax=Leptopilina heterotoma TaxID=63436 RepID=UPI001CA95E14|nr:uncharacterized protein LOC122504737 [Leptopilina heterotoma]
MKECIQNVNVNKDDNYLSKQKNITSLPVEIILKIFNFLPQSNLKILEHVNRHFQQISRDPILWKVYKIENNEDNNNLQFKNIIQELKRMTFLEKCSLINNIGCDRILHQISLSNKNLKKLHIRNRNLRGLAWAHYLRSTRLTQLLERCHNLHTITIDKCALRGLKIYKILGGFGLKMKIIKIPANKTQLRTFIENSTYIKEKDRQMIFNLTAYDRQKEYVLLRYESHTIRIYYNNCYPQVMQVDITSYE